MFSRFKKPDPQAEQRPAVVAAAATTARAAAASSAKPATTAARPTAEATGADKEKKRKERLGQLKQELHKRLLKKKIEPRSA